MTSKSSSWSLENDLSSVFGLSGEVFSALRNSKIFMTGGTGFIGCWLLESIKYADLRLNLNIEVTVLTRSYESFLKKAPHLATYKAFKFIEGDVTNFREPSGEFTCLIHAATDASAELNEKNPIAMFDTVVEGTRRVLDFALKKKTRKVLYLSSGAIYGQQPWEMERVAEGWFGAPNCLDPRSAYAEGKRAAEMLCALYWKQHGLDVSIARIFALLGPYLSLDIHFAAGNFIRDSMSGKEIVVNGNGLPCRSYLYASDLTVWLLHLLLRGQPNKAYNVGSDESVSIKELAEKTSKLLGGPGFKIMDKNDLGWNLGRYVPDTNLAHRELGLHRTVSLDESIRRTAIWNGWKESN